jgi:hypothetical protein
VRKCISAAIRKRKNKRMNRPGKKELKGAVTSKPAKPVVVEEPEEIEEGEEEFDGFEEGDEEFGDIEGGEEMDDELGEMEEGDEEMVDGDEEAEEFGDDEFPQHGEEGMIPNAPMPDSRFFSDISC